MVNLVTNNETDLDFLFMGNVKDVRKANIVFVFAELDNTSIRSLISKKIEQIVISRNSKERPNYLIESEEFRIAKALKPQYLVNTKNFQMACEEYDEIEQVIKILQNALLNLNKTDKYNKDSVLETFKENWSSSKLSDILKNKIINYCLILIEISKNDRENILDDLITDVIGFHITHATVVKTSKLALMAFLKEGCKKDKFYIFIGDSSIFHHSPKEFDVRTRIQENKELLKVLEKHQYMIYMHNSNITNKDDEKESEKSATAGST